MCEDLAQLVFTHTPRYRNVFYKTKKSAGQSLPLWGWGWFLVALVQHVTLG